MQQTQNIGQLTAEQSVRLVQIGIRKGAFGPEEQLERSYTTIARQDIAVPDLQRFVQNARDSRPGQPVRSEQSDLTIARALWLHGLAQPGFQSRLGNIDGIAQELDVEPAVLRTVFHSADATIGAGADNVQGASSSTRHRT
jgi:hypothetical protein